MSSIGIKIPITYDSGDGFTMLKTLNETVNQNLKMLILTIPGERVMEPEFGVGIQQYLFSNFSEDINADIAERINSQVKTYMPSVIINNINFHGSEPDSNRLSLSIEYYVPDIGLSDLLEFTI